MITIKLVTGNDEGSPLTSFDRVVGQQAVVNKLAFFLSSHTTNNAMPTFLFCGSHGLGKTYLSKKVANNMHRRFVEINGATIGKTKDFMDKILLGQIIGDTPVTVLVDEAHAMNSEIANLFLSILAPEESGKSYINYNRCLLEFDHSKINFILATTDTYKMASPLINRAEIIYFEPYSRQDLLAMLKMYLPDITLDCDEKKLTDICRGRGRDAYMFSQNIIRHCIINKKKVFSNADLDNLASLFQMYAGGITKQEFNVLKAIGENEPVALTSLAMVLMVGEENLENELEVRLRELQLITNSTRGRMLTEAGRKYLEENNL